MQQNHQNLLNMAAEYQQSAIEQVQVLEILAFISDKVDVYYLRRWLEY